MPNEHNERTTPVKSRSTGMWAAAVVFAFALPALIALRLPIDAGMRNSFEAAPPASTADAGPPAGYLSGALSENPRDEAQPESF